MTEPTCVTNSETLTLSVGAVPHDPLTDESREEAIQLAGRLFLKHMDRLNSGDKAALGDARRALRLQNLLIAGRSAEQVLRMEQERGIA